MGAYRYYRPDTKTQLWLGSDRAVALETVEVLNRFFAYAENGKDFDWGGVGEKAIDLLRKKKFTYLPDNLRDTRLQVFAQKHQAEFAATSEPRIDTEIKADSMPKWAAHLLRQTKKNAATRGIPFKLEGRDLADMVAMSKGRCMVTGIMLEIATPERKGLRRPWMPSIDRIDSAGGYTRENCRIVCVAANLAMGQWGESVLIEMAKAIAVKLAK